MTDLLSSLLGLALAQAPTAEAPVSSSDWESAPPAQLPVPQAAAPQQESASATDRSDRPWYALGGFGFAYYGFSGFGPAIRAGVGYEWWERGLGVEVQGQMALPILGMYWIADGNFEDGALTSAGTGFPIGDLTARFREAVWNEECFNA